MFKQNYEVSNRDKTVGPIGSKLKGVLKKIFKGKEQEEKEKTKEIVPASVLDEKESKVYRAINRG
mgnify:CR=1 FL=1